MQPTHNTGERAYYVYQDSGQHVGPVTAELLAKGIATGKVPRDAHVGAVGDSQWHPVLSVPEVTSKLAELEAAHAPRPPAQAPPSPGTEPDVTNIMVRDEDIEAMRAQSRASSKAPVAPAAPKMASAPKMPAVSAGAPLPPKTQPPPPPAAPSPPMAPQASVAPSPPMAPQPAVPPFAPAAAQTAMMSPAPPAVAIPAPASFNFQDQAPASMPPTNPQPLPMGVAPSPMGAQPAPPAPATAPYLGQPPASMAPAVPAAAEPKKEEKKEEKKDDKPPVVDPKVAILLPLGVFAVFGVIGLILLVIGVVKRPPEPKEPPGVVHGAISTQHPAGD